MKRTYQIVGLLMCLFLVFITSSSYTKAVNVEMKQPRIPSMRTIQLEKQLVFPVFLQEEVKSTSQTNLLESKIEEILEHPRLQGAIVGLSIRNTDGELIYSHHGDTLLRPASNLKLFTAAAALETLGPDYRFKTELWIDGKIERNKFKGDIYLRGKGDPTLLKKDLDELASQLVEKGITEIEGNLIGDDTWYDNVRYSPDLIWSDETYYYGGAISALTMAPNEEYDAGAVLVYVSPGSAVGEPIQVDIVPENDYIQIVNEAVTVSQSEIPNISVERKHGSNRLIIQGKFPVNGLRNMVKIAVWEPTDYVLHMFKQSLEEQGVRFNKNTQLLQGSTPETAQLVATKESMPLEEIVIPFMKLSNNIHGETFVKEMGKVIHDEGSWNKGIAVMENQLINLGLDGYWVIRDGSGISDKNLITPNQITKLLSLVKKKSWYSAFEQSLPVSGEPGKFGGGSLQYRMGDEELRGKIKAKTGYITGATTLSGYATTQSGEELIFSIMINNYLGGSMAFIQDEICRVLVNL